MPIISRLAALTLCCWMASAGLARAGNPVTLDPASLQSVVTSLQDAGRQNKLGTVSGRVYGEPSRRDASPRPREAASVLLMPYLSSLVAELDAAKQSARDSMESYRGTVTRLDAIKGRYESALKTGGGTELIRRVNTGSDGQFRFEQVPEGEWLLLVQAEISRQQIPHPRMIRKDPAEKFAENMEHRGHHNLVFWWRTLGVRSGQVTSLDLNDRNFSVSGVKEDLALPKGAPTPFIKN